MTKELEKKIKEAKSEEELLKVLNSNDVEELTDEDMEFIYGGGESFGCDVSSINEAEP